MQFSVLSSTLVVLRPSGHLDASYGLELEHQLSHLVSSHTGQQIVLHLEEVESIDSAGLMTLVSAFQLARRSNFDIQLWAVPPALKIVLELSQLDRVFTIHNPAPSQLPLAA